MDRLLNGPGWRREEQRYQALSSQRIARTPALSRGIAEAASVPTSGHSSRHFSPEMPLKTTNEKELLRCLNERFAGFIEKVRGLENQNRALEKEIEVIRLKATSATSLASQYEPELQELRRQVREIATQKHQMELEHKRVQDECKELIEKCEEVARSRGEAEVSISALKKYVDSAYVSKQEIERKATALAEEIEFLKRNHEAEVGDILTQMKETRVCSEVRSFGKGELTAALSDIRTQLEGRAFCSDAPSEQRYGKQLVKLTKAAEKDRDALIASKAEIHQYKRQLQSKTAELESFRGMREALERQLYDLEQRHTADIHRYQDTIRELDQELQNTKYDMISHVHEYHDLLNVKMALDAEIYSYRKLLEGEESRYSTLSDVQIPGPYVYRQSPVYTLPSGPRVGGVTRKAEPQYKFVEEIITETTREDIEISDVGSDDAEEQKEGVKVCCEKESEASTEVKKHLEDKITQKSDIQDYQESLKPGHLDNEGIPIENEPQSLKMFTDVSTDLKEDNIHAKLAQNKSTASEQTREKDTDPSYNTDDGTALEIKENVLDVKTQRDKCNEADVEKKDKQDKEKEINQVRITEPEPAEQTSTPDAVTEPGKSAEKEISAKPIKENATNETQQVAVRESFSAEKISEKIKSVEVDTSSADSQPVPPKAEAGEETHAKSEAVSRQSVETAQADVLNTTNAVDVQKSLVGKIKTETLLNNEIKEIQPKEKKEMDPSKPEVNKVFVKPEKKDSVQPTEEEKTQEIDIKPAAKEIDEVKTSERKESQIKELMDSKRTEKNIEFNKMKKEVDQMQIKQQDKISGTESKSEEQLQKSAAKDSEEFNTKLSFKKEEKETTKSAETPKNEIQKDKETKDEEKTEKQDLKNHKTSTDIKNIDKVRSEGPETDSITSKDEQPEQILSKSLPEEQEKYQTKTDKDVYEIEDTKTEKSHQTETKQDATKKDIKTMKDLEKNSAQDSKTSEPSEKALSEAGEDGMKVGEREKAEAVTKNGANI